MRLAALALHTVGMTTQTLETQILLGDNSYIEVYDTDGDIRLYTAAKQVTDVELTPRQARRLARLLLQFADDTEEA